ncbi:MAG: D-3-phosphoglycerate dehydrogenase [Pigmentiphaga sp.]|nr:D-3-phosphoglycerate dehydrogenase [Pigmentiphaga sp.]
MTKTVFVVRDHTMDPLLDQLSDRLRAEGVDVRRGPLNEPGVVAPLPEATVNADLQEADVAVVSSRWLCPRSTLSAGRRLKGVVGATIGVETIDLAAADDLGLIVANGGASEHIASMAEAAIMLMMNLRYSLAFSEAVMRGEQSRPSVTEVRASTLQGCTVGIVGLGRIGRAVAERLSAFGVRLLAYSPRADRADTDPAIRLVSLETVMAESDVVGVFVAVRPDNRRLINARTLALMKPSAFLVNVARGEAIDEQALIEVLTNRRIAGAALDTFEVEPLPADSPLRTLDNVILTPHMVGHTKESVASIPAMAFANVMAILNGTLPPSCKNPSIEAKWRARLSGLSV